MKRKTWPVALAAGFAAACTANANWDLDLPGRGDGPSLHDRTLTLDTHVDIGLDYATDTNDPGGFSANQVDLPKMRAGGLDAAFFIVYTPQGELTDDGYTEAKSIAETRYYAIRRMTRAYPGQIELALTANDVRRIDRSGKLVALIGMENPYPLGPSVADVPMWKERGVRYMSITHSAHNQFGDSSSIDPDPDAPAGPNDGLSDLGRDLVAELNKAGIMVDVSHAAKSTMMQAADASVAPVIASHSGASAVNDVARNVDDEQLRKLAEVGGVVQVVALGNYVRAPTPERIARVTALREKYGIQSFADFNALSDEQREAYRAEQRALDDAFPVATVEHLVDHIDHVVETVGIDYVGISSDFDGGGGINGWSDASQTENVTAELVRRGYSEEDIAKIWGGNLLRVMADVERVARELNAA